MQKDVIYIDTEDDITAIIGKVKASTEHVVALVPPKRIGAIQSAVNLKLVHRAAEQADKRLVIVSNNAALMALASSAGIPVAKNLQSKPELAEIPTLDIDDGDDVIDGGEIAVSEQGAKAVSEVSEDKAADAVVAENAAMAASAGVASSLASAKKSPKTSGKLADATSALGATALAAKDKAKIPNFDKFRKKLFLIVATVLLLVGFFVWAFIFAPRARVIITAKTSESALNTQVKTGDALTTDLKAGTVKSVTKTSQKAVSQSFTATGKKDVGTKATGTVHFAPTSGNLLNVISSGATIQAGTKVTSSSGSVYTTDNTVVFDSDWSGSKLAQGVDAAVTAVENGSSYNGANGTATGPSGFTTTFKTITSGGTDKTVTIVQQSDVDSVSGNAVSQSDIDAAKKELTSQFGSDYVVLDASFKSDIAGIKAAPAVGAEAADGKGTFAGNATFSLVGVAKSELNKFLDAYFAQQVDGKANQKVYDNGGNSVSFTNVSATDGGYTANITTNGKIGPKIDETSLKEYVKGKRFGEIQTYIQQINGVENVDVKFSPFWVNSAPKDVKKIQVEFKVNG